MSEENYRGYPLRDSVGGKNKNDEDENNIYVQPQILIYNLEKGRLVDLDSELSEEQKEVKQLLYNLEVDVDRLKRKIDNIYGEKFQLLYNKLEENYVKLQDKISEINFRDSKTKSASHT